MRVCGVFNIQETRSFSAITTTFVEVEFDALAEALEGVTVEVKNSKGEIVEVVSIDIPKGATSAQFDFVKAITEDDRTGVWTVDGKAYSFVELKLVADIVLASATPVNEVKLLGLLNKAEIQNINEDWLADYATEIRTENPATFADVQKNVNDVNEAKGELADEAAVVKAVVDATNQIQLLAALEANFERVNPDWIAEYATELVVGTAMLDLEGPDNYFADPATATSVDADAIQTAIDQVNNDVIFAAGTGLNVVADTSAKQAAVTALIKAWIEDDVAPAKTKENAIKASQIKEAAFRVAEATTENSLYNALVAYANITPDAKLKASELNANLKTFYKDAFDTLTKVTLVTAIQGGTDDIKGNIVEEADDAAVEAAVVAIGNAAGAINTAESATPGSSTAAEKAALKTALQKLADYTSHKTADDEKFLMSTIDDALLVDYAAEFVVDTIGTGSDVDAVQTAVGNVNDGAALDVAVDIINDKESTAVQVRNALIDIAIDVDEATVGNVFLNLSAQAKLEVAEFVIEERPAAGYADIDAILKSDASGALGVAMTAHSTKLGEFNTIGDLGDVGTTTITTKTALDTYAYAPYKALTNAEKLAVATEINELTKLVGDVETPLDFSGEDKVKTLAEANAYIDAAIAAIK